MPIFFSQLLAHVTRSRKLQGLVFPECALSSHSDTYIFTSLIKNSVVFTAHKILNIDVLQVKFVQIFYQSAAAPQTIRIMSQKSSAGLGVDSMTRVHRGPAQS